MSVQRTFAPKQQGDPTISPPVLQPDEYEVFAGAHHISTNELMKLIAEQGPDRKKLTEIIMARSANTTDG